jgi:hypothetical protein
MAHLPLWQAVGVMTTDPKVDLEAYRKQLEQAALQAGHAGARSR